MPIPHYNSKAFSVYLDPQKVWECIETGRDVDELYPDDFKIEHIIEKNTKIAKQILDEGEEFIFLEHTDGDYAITSHARIYNFKHNRFVTLKIGTKQDMYASVRQTKFSVQAIFKQQGWKWDMDEFRQRELENAKRD